MPQWQVMDIRTCLRAVQCKRQDDRRASQEHAASDYCRRVSCAPTPIAVCSNSSLLKMCVVFDWMKSIEKSRAHECFSRGNAMERRTETIRKLHFCERASERMHISSICSLFLKIHAKICLNSQQTRTKWKRQLHKRGTPSLTNVDTLLTKILPCSRRRA